MQVYEFAIMDSKGRILIPSKIRSLLGLREGMRFMIVADTERNELRLIPIAEESARVYRLRVVMRDIVGALAKVLQTVASFNVDLLLTQSRTIRRREVAEWIAIVDLSTSGYDIEQIVNTLKGLDVVHSVECEKLD